MKVSKPSKVIGSVMSIVSSEAHVTAAVAATKSRCSSDCNKSEASSAVSRVVVVASQEPVC